MKVKNLFITFGLSLALGVVAAVGAGQKAPQKVEAYDKDTVYYCLTGVFNGVEHWTDYIDAPSDGKNAAVLLNQSLTAGDTFKFKVKGSWDDALTFGSFNSSAGAYNAFCWNNGDDNTYCSTTGTYNFYVYEEGGVMKVSAEFADSNTASYSYVLSSNSTLGYAYMWTGEQKLRDWGSSPVVNGQAYDIKFTNNAYDYYGLYRIDDRILSGWSNLIIKNSDGSQKTADIGRTAGNKEELYMCGASVATKTKLSNEYKAMEFLYDLISHRGSATYDNYTFNYSICATSPEDAYNLVTKYDGFSSDIKTLLTSATVRTYNVEGEYGEGDENKAYAAVSDMVDALRVVAAKYNGGGSGLNNNLGFGFSNNSITIIIIIASSLVLITVAGCFLIKRKHN